MKLVKFKDGKYGLRKWGLFLGFQFLDLEDIGYWWSSLKHVKNHCKGTIKQCLEAIEENGDYGKVVKLK